MVIYTLFATAVFETLDKQQDKDTITIWYTFITL